MCSGCSERFPTKISVANHFSRSHPTTTLAVEDWSDDEEEEGGGFRVSRSGGYDDDGKKRDTPSPTLGELMLRVVTPPLRPNQALARGEEALGQLRKAPSDIDAEVTTPPQVWVKPEEEGTPHPTRDMTTTVGRYRGGMVTPTPETESPLSKEGSESAALGIREATDEGLQTPLSTGKDPPILPTLGDKDETPSPSISQQLRCQWQEGDLSQMTATPPEETLVPPPSTSRSLLEAHQFIPCSSAPPGEGRSGDLQSLWSAARASLTATSADITLTQDSVTLSTGWHKLTWDKRKDTSQALRKAIHTH
eukprot:Em0007g1297a